MTTTQTYATEVPASFPELDTIVYLTGASTDESRAAKRTDLGLLVTPATSLNLQIDEYELYGADNGLFNENHPEKGFDFDPEAWLAWVAALPRENCLFVTLPDVLHWFDTGEVDKKGKKKYACIGDFEATLARSAEYVEKIRELGFPVALVAQDGLTSLDQIPFAVDAIFVGGSDAYKLGPDAAALVAEAKAAGKWTHIGRVNSFRRIAHCFNIGADSADGTYLAFGPRKNYPIMISWLDRLRQRIRPTAAELAA